MGENEDGLEELELELKDNIAEEVKDSIIEVKCEVPVPGDVMYVDNKELEEPKKERKIYKGKKNFRGLDYIAAQEPKHAAGIKMQVRGCLAWLEGADKMSYKQMVMLPYAEFMNLLGQFAKATGIENDSF